MLVVGAGPVAARKVAGLAAAGARVRVVAADGVAVVGPRRWSTERAASGRSRPATSTASGSWSRRRDRVTSTPRWRAAATAAGLWVNAADQPDDCSFILPAIARNGPLTVAVRTDGASPALARRLRDHAGRAARPTTWWRWPPRLAAERAARARPAARSTEDVDWSAAIDPVLPPRPTHPSV